MSDAFTVEETAGSKATRAAIARIAEIAPEMCAIALDEISGKQLRDTVAAFRLQKTPGGPAWAPNHPNLLRFKREVLAQVPAQVGTINGQLKMSPSREMNTAALESRVGSSDKNAQSFSDGGPVPMWLFFRRDEKWYRVWMGRGTVSPPRRFVPTVERATRQAAQIVSRVERDTMKRLGLTVKSDGKDQMPVGDDA